MAFAPVAVSRFPSVPRASGVPAVLRSAAEIEDKVIIAATDAIKILQAFQGPKWGVFDVNMNPVIIGDSMVSQDFRKEWRLSDFPIEQGGFATYDKVVSPFEMRLVFTKGGDDDDRNAFLNLVEGVCRSLTLFNVVAPELVYNNISLTHYDYRRTSTNGVTLLTVEVWCKEVRLTAVAQYTNNSSTPDAAEPVNGGPVNGATPNGQQAATGGSPAATPPLQPAAGRTYPTAPTPPPSNLTPLSPSTDFAPPGSPPGTGPVPLSDPPAVYPPGTPPNPSFAPPPAPPVAPPVAPDQQGGFLPSAPTYTPSPVAPDQQGGAVSAAPYVAPPYD